MATVQLDPSREKHLDELARAEGRDPRQVAQRIIEDYLDFQMLPEDSEELWAEASLQLAPEVIDDEPWSDDGSHGPR